MKKPTNQVVFKLSLKDSKSQKSKLSVHFKCNPHTLKQIRSGLTWFAVGCMYTAVIASAFIFQPIYAMSLF